MFSMNQWFTTALSPASGREMTSIVFGTVARRNGCPDDPDNGASSTRRTTMRNLLIGTGVAAALSLALLAGPTFAQIDPGTFTTANVDPADPFGPIEVDTAMTDIPTFLATLSAETLLELQQRCSVVTSNATLYDATAVAFCTVAIAADTTPVAPPTPVTPPA
jgi:hypothetical protein